MNIDIENDGAFLRRLRVTIPAEDVRRELDSAFLNIGRSVQLRGFRKGRAPRRVLEARFGTKVRNDLAQDLIRQGFLKAIQEHSLDIVGQPALLDRGEIIANDDFAFTIGVDVRPVIKLDKYIGVDVYWPVWKVEDSELEHAIGARLEGHARMTVVEDRSVEHGDMVMVELKVQRGDEVLVEHPGTMIRTAADPYYPGVDEILVGLAIGEEKTGTVQFSADARDEAVAGVEAEVTVKVLMIQMSVVPALDEEIAAELGHDSVDAMRESVLQELSKGREDSARNQARANLLQALIDANPFDVPESMTDENVKMLEEELRFQQKMRGQDPRTLQLSAEDQAMLRARAAFSVRGALILESVVTAEGIEVTDEDVEAKYAQLASDRGQTVEAIKGWFVKDGALDEFRDRILEEKALDWLLERAQVSHEEPSPSNSESDAVVENEAETVDLSSLTVKELKARAKAQGVEGFSKLKKAELIERLS